MIVLGKNVRISDFIKIFLRHRYCCTKLFLHNFKGRWLCALALELKRNNYKCMTFFQQNPNPISSCVFWHRYGWELYYGTVDWWAVVFISFSWGKKYHLECRIPIFVEGWCYYCGAVYIFICKLAKIYGRHRKFSVNSLQWQ